MLTYRNLTQVDYDTQRYQVLLNVEETGIPKPTPYLDFKGINSTTNQRSLDGKESQQPNNGWITIVVAILTLIVFFISASNCNADQQSEICSEIHKLIILRQQNRAPADFVVESQEQGGGDDIYPNLDIDGDGAADSIIRSCGAGLDTLCFLFVKLSNKKEFELEEEKFFLIRVNKKIYALVGESLSESETIKLGTRKIYQITNQAIQLVCPAV